MEIVGLQRCIVKVPTKTIYWKHSSYEITKKGSYSQSTHFSDYVKISVGLPT